MSLEADFTELDEGGERVVRFSGRLTIARLGDVPQRLDVLEVRPVRADVSAVDRVDTVGAWILHKLKRDYGAEIVGASDFAERLIRQVTIADDPAKTHHDDESHLRRILQNVGEATIDALSSLKGLLAFFGGLLIATGTVLRHPGRLRLNAVVQRFETVGVSALGIVGLMSFLIGIVIAQQGAVQLRQFGAEVFTINLVGRITTRELGVLMTAIMVAGRSGSAFAAQIGSMKLAEEVDAMRTIGVPPMEALILPRVLATTLLMPLLGFYSTVLMIIGGGLLCWIGLGIPPETFILRLREVVPMTDLWVGLLKAPVFGMIIGLAGCYQGMQVRGNNEEVGQRTTAAVVQAIFLVIVLDAFFAVFFSSVGWG
ncbi:MlaE family ABC transporter permease [Parasphingopyxis lamellibrachiae]|uniref:Phospholipid/cholesterol/gamma-HCH transport system permease protein n=1 Tax=Parasphingopyxis lamellibrachiae TaxID=680125 RepID=A0A3D9FFZ5_9SPHN|nr:ABC transporter permease [Parasphingopyxis lamellibrachiae]RED16740.1 phospholipid/cholesterol/gamma-HCH transport system permease protein [Parasphingopyxis lamellibrachiae]